jgi:hypothetical protein
MLVKQGDAGPMVDLVQSRLRDLGYLADNEAGFGPDTARAVRHFQEARGLRPDGVVGPHTWPRLFPPVPFTRKYLDGVLYAGRQVFDELDQVVAAVTVGEGGAFDALQLNGDGAGLSCGILQWAQAPGSLYGLLMVWQHANPAKFVELLGQGDQQEALNLLEQTRDGGTELALWQDPWPLRFWQAGRDPEFQRGQRDLARRQLADRLQEGYRRYPAEFKPGGAIALRALVMMADVGNQAGPGGLRRALSAAAAQGLDDEADFIAALGDYVEDIIRRKYGDPNFGNTAGRHAVICRTYGLNRVDWPALLAKLSAKDPDSPLPA